MYGGVGCTFGGGLNPVLPPNKAFAADGQGSPVFGVDFSTLSRSLSEGYVAAAEMQALGGSLFVQ